MLGSLLLIHVNMYGSFVSINLRILHCNENEGKMSYFFVHVYYFIGPTVMQTLISKGFGEARYNHIRSKSRCS